MCGLMEGWKIRASYVLDTGCAWTLVTQDLLSPQKRTSGQVSITCAHGDVAYTSSGRHGDGD